MSQRNPAFGKNTHPGWKRDYIPTVDEWLAWWSRKLDGEGGVLSAGSVENGEISGCSLDGLTTVVPSGAVIPRSVAGHFSDWLTVRMFGAFGDGKSHTLSTTTEILGTDTTGWSLAQWRTIFPRASALTQEIDYLAHDAALQVADRIFSPPGIYRFGQDTLTLPSRDGVRLLGAGKNATFWVTDSATADVICTSATAQSGQEVSCGCIYSTVAKTAGFGIKMTGGHSYRSECMVFGRNMWASYGLFAWTTQFNYSIIEPEINSGAYGIVLGDGGKANVVQNVWIKRGSAYNTTIAAILYSNVSGFYVDDIDIGSGVIGHHFNPQFNQTATSGWVSRTGGDTMQAQGILCYQPAGQVSDIDFESVWISNCGLSADSSGVHPPGIQIDAGNGNANIWDLVFTNPRVQYCGGIGFSLVMEKGGTIVNPQVNNNGRLSRGGAHGIYVNCDTFSIIGGNSGPSPQNSIPTQDYGLVLDEGCLNYYVAGLNLNSNVVAGAQISSQARGTITGCQNWATKSRGVVSFPAGQMSVSVATDMGPVVDKNRIQISMSSSLAGAGSFWVSGVDGRTFTISSAAAPVSDVFINWSVDQERY